MKKLPKPTLIEERDFPFESSISYGVEDGFHKLHWHSEIEICYIKNGTGKYLINGIDYDFYAGDIFIIGNDDIHLCHDDSDLIMQVVMFDPAIIGSSMANPFDFEYFRMLIDSSYGKYKKIEHTSECALLLSGIMTEIETEYSLMKKGYEMMIKSLLLRFFALIFRSSPDDYNSDKPLSRNAVDKVRSILLYIETHYKENISLELIERKFDVSRPYLCGIFKAATGISPMDYVIRKRIAEVKYQLISTSKSVLEISEECGFHSLSNFNFLFRKIAGCTPSKYRKK